MSVSGFGGGRLPERRWAPVPDGGDEGYGVPVARVRGLVERWRHHYDWRAWENRLNAYPQYTTLIDGTRVHFLHVRSPEPDALPLVLSHGWPGSVAEYLEVIGPLSDPRRHGLDPSIAFDVVVPSLPGFGFSGPNSAGRPRTGCSARTSRRPGTRRRTTTRSGWRSWGRRTRPRGKRSRTT
jgi:epoxide hydrolase